MATSTRVKTESWGRKDEDDGVLNKSKQPFSEIEIVHVFVIEFLFKFSIGGLILMTSEALSEI